MATQSITFQRMWTLIHNNNKTFFGQANYHTPEKFPPELLVGIFWEETLFQNIRQVGNKGPLPGFGFGQVQPDAIRLVNLKWSTTFNVNGSDILQNEEQSVQVAGLLLAKLWEDQVNGVRLGKQINSPEQMRKAALFNYAGGTARPQNALIPPKWLSCMKALLALKLDPPATLQLTPGLAGQIQAGLDKVRGGDWAGTDRKVFP
jgi:hypothetical protein